jgi:SAM-dependent methyltransferase
MSKTEAVVRAEDYYDSGSADEFYKNIWGGEDIHIGLYATPDENIPAASRRTVETMAAELAGIDSNSRVLDLGAGYGGSGRYLAKTYGCEVVCLNISETQNARNVQLNKEQGLDHLVSVVHGDFENVGMEDGSFDFIWSQDAILHSGDRGKVLDEVKRLLKPGGLFVFTDPMQSDDCPDGVLQPILDRIQLSTLGSFKYYREELTKRGFEEVKVQDLTHQLRNHYNRVREELLRNREAAVGFSGETYVANMDKGLQHWVNGADKGYLAWGIINFRKK